MKRYCFAIDLIDDPVLINEYEETRDSFPGIKGITASGIIDMEIYRTGDRLFMVIETDDSFSFKRKPEATTSNLHGQTWETLMRNAQKDLNGKIDSDEYKGFLKKGIEIVETHLKDSHFDIKLFSREMGMGRSNLFRKIKAVSGLSTNQFIRYVRLMKAAELIIHTDIRIKEVAYEVGINDLAYFREQFVKAFGVTPSDYKKKYKQTLEL